MILGSAPLKLDAFIDRNAPRDKVGKEQDR